jgi:hypothetical protein
LEFKYPGELVADCGFHELLLDSLKPLKRESIQPFVSSDLLNGLTTSFHRKTFLVEPQLISSPTHPSASKPRLNAIDSWNFLNCLQQQHCSLAFTTYQTGKRFLVGRKFASEEATPVSKADQTLSIFERTDNHCRGMCASPDVHDMMVVSLYLPHLPLQPPSSAFHELSN